LEMQATEKKEEGGKKKEEVQEELGESKEEGVGKGGRWWMECRTWSARETCM